jgi:hypothetical protein
VSDQHDRDELLELLARYADMADTRAWWELAPTVLSDEIVFDAGSLGVPAATLDRDAWCAATEQLFAGWAATHHVISSPRIVVDGDRATVRAHVRAEHWLPSAVAAGGPDCWLVVGFYDDVAVRTPEGWRFSSITLTATHQQHPELVASARV